MKEDARLIGNVYRGGCSWSLADIAGINRANHKTIGALLQGAPFTRAVSIQTGDKESAIIQQVDIRCAIAFIEGAGRREFVNTSRRAVIANVKGDAAVRVGHIGRSEEQTLNSSH